MFFRRRDQSSVSLQTESVETWAQSVSRLFERTGTSSLRRQRARRRSTEVCSSLQDLESRTLLAIAAVIVEDSVPGGGINSGTYGSNPSSIIDVAGTTYFVATDSVNGTELWRINRSGVAELVEDAIPGGGLGLGSTSSQPESLTNVNGTLYFVTENSVSEYPINYCGESMEPGLRN